LLRTPLDHSTEEVVRLESELEHLKLYLEIEASRFEEVFEYEIKYSDQLNLAKVKIPPMLIQPLVENSIWHGLQDVDREKKILIEIIEELNYLKIIIDDNGKGVSDSFIDNDKRSYGILNTKKRIELFNLGKINEAFEFIDKKKVSREDGVKVIMKLIRK
jgi:LytS/YehU family sensor histidine kinase